MNIFQFISICYCFILSISNTDALDFETAFKDGKFEEITGSNLFLLDPLTTSSKSMYFDPWKNMSYVSKSQFTPSLTFETPNLADDVDFTVGISLVILKFVSIYPTPTNATVRTYIDHKEINSRTIENDVNLPETKILEKHIVKSWDFVDKDDFGF